LLANTLYNDGDAESAQAVAAQAAEAAEAARAYEELGAALNCRASALVALARPVQALAVFQEALAIRERHAPTDVPATLGNLAVTFGALGSYEDALTTGRQAIRAAERLASRAHRNLAALHVARALFSRGRWDEAVATVAEVAAEAAPAARGMLIGPPLLVALYRGERERAGQLIAEFDAHPDVGAAFESDYRSLRETALAHLADVWSEALAVINDAQSGDYAEWPTWLPLAIDLLTRCDDDQPLYDALAALDRDEVPKTSPVVSAQLRRLQALLAARSAELELAQEHWSEALQLVKSAGMVFDEAVLSLELFEHLPNHPDARGGLESTADTFSALGATPWLRRARAAVAGERLQKAGPGLGTLQDEPG
jgi:tetratricopeptide (TPR) repeat protein